MPRNESQKLKILYVAKFFLEYSDENHPVTAGDIADYLQTERGITAERRSIYRDIAALRDEFGFDIQGGQGGKFCLASREFELDDLRLLAECVYATKFISQPKARELEESISSLCRNYQAADYCNELFLRDRVKSAQKGTLTMVSTIRRAMATRWEGKNHTPEKISFLYLRHTVIEKEKMVPRWSGRRFVVSPYKLLIYDGNYYLLAYADNTRDIRTYRIDRMKDVRLEGQPRAGQAEFEKIDMASYVKQTMFMIPGELHHVSILFDNTLLDVVMERFGTDGDVFYRPEGKKQFVLNADVNITDQFFAWLCGFGTKAKILGPEDVVQRMRNFLKSIFEQYETCGSQS